MAEFWDVYNKHGKKKNKVIKRGEVLRRGEYHIISQGWIRCDKNSFLLQKRAYNKKLFGGMWYSSLGGAVIAGEEPKEGLIREAKEELGIDITNDKIYLKRIIKEEYFIFYIYLIEKIIDLKELKLQKEEVSDVKIATLDEMYKLMEKGEMEELPYYSKFFSKICKTPFTIGEEI